MTPAQAKAHLLLAEIREKMLDHGAQPRYPMVYPREQIQQLSSSPLVAEALQVLTESGQLRVRD